MRNNYPYLKDSDFLQEVVKLKNVVYFVKVTILDWYEEPINSLEGKVTTATININGNSAIRRTANINFVAEQDDKDAAGLLGLNKKIYLQIGYENFTSQYTNYSIIWFPLGLYVVTGMAFNHGLNGISVSLELKDKMCLLDGSCGGVIPAAAVFDNYKVQNEDGTTTIVRPTIYQIITQLVNHFGGEQLGNIIISDLDTRIKQVMSWAGSTPLFLLWNGEGSYIYTTSEVQANQGGGYTEAPGSPFYAGSAVGYILTDFTYPGDLIGNAGDSVVTILEKIKSVLGNFEYFYDLDGCFRFQEIKNYLNNSQSKYILQALNKTQLVPDYLASTGQAYAVKRFNQKSVFSFKDNPDLVVSYTNSPSLISIKNDYIVWGLRKSSTSGTQYPIRYHLAIDKKPQVQQHRVVKYVDPQNEKLEKWYSPLCFASRNNFPEKGKIGLIYCAENSGHPVCYVWKTVNKLSQYVAIDSVPQNITPVDWRTELYLQGVAAEP